mgnify:CR=1 FL=1
MALDSKVQEGLLEVDTISITQIRISLLWLIKTFQAVERRRILDRTQRLIRCRIVLQHSLST